MLTTTAETIMVKIYALATVKTIVQTHQSKTIVSGQMQAVFQLLSCFFARQYSF